MKSKIEAKDFFSITEMIGKNVVMQMNEYTYKYILGKVFGFNDFKSITNIIANINGLEIVFDKNMKNNEAILISGYNAVLTYISTAPGILIPKLFI